MKYQKDTPPILVCECQHHLVDSLIANNHYSKTVTSNRWKSFAVYWYGILMGAMQIGYGIRPESKRHILKGTTSETVKEFDRMWLSDSMPKNSESRCIGVLLRHLRKNYPELKAIISYADGLRGHTGTIYRASNFFYIGAIEGEFYYIPTKNEWVHPVTMWHRHGSRSGKVLKEIYPDIQHIRGKQYRYIYFLDPEWRDRLLLPILPYPKKCGGGVSGCTALFRGAGEGSNPIPSHFHEKLKKTF